MRANQKKKNVFPGKKRGFYSVGRAHTVHETEKNRAAVTLFKITKKSVSKIGVTIVQRWAHEAKPSWDLRVREKNVLKKT